MLDFCRSIQEVARFLGIDALDEVFFRRDTDLPEFTLRYGEF